MWVLISRPLKLFKIQHEMDLSFSLITHTFENSFAWLDSYQSGSQAKSSFSHHRGSSITTVCKFPFLWETTYCFPILFCPRAPILNCHESPGRGIAKWPRSAPQLGVTTVNPSTPLLGARHMQCAITATQQCHWLPRAEAGHLLEGHATTK